MATPIPKDEDTDTEMTPARPLDPSDSSRPKEDTDGQLLETIMSPFFFLRLLREPAHEVKPFMMGWLLARQCFVVLETTNQLGLDCGYELPGVYTHSMAFNVRAPLVRIPPSLIQKLRESETGMPVHKLYCTDEPVDPAVTANQRAYHMYFGDQDQHWKELFTNNFIDRFIQHHCLLIRLASEHPSSRHFGRVQVPLAIHQHYINEYASISGLLHKQLQPYLFKDPSGIVFEYVCGAEWDYIQEQLELKHYDTPYVRFTYGHAVPNYWPTYFCGGMVAHMSTAKSNNYTDNQVIRQIVRRSTLDLAFNQFPGTLFDPAPPLTEDEDYGLGQLLAYNMLDSAKVLTTKYQFNFMVVPRVIFQPDAPTISEQLRVTCDYYLANCQEVVMRENVY